MLDLVFGTALPTAVPLSGPAARSDLSISSLCRAGGASAGGGARSRPLPPPATGVLTCAACSATPARPHPAASSAGAVPAVSPERDGREVT